MGNFMRDEITIKRPGWQVDTGADVRSIAHAIQCYARERGIPFALVETSIVYPEVKL